MYRFRGDYSWGQRHAGKRRLGSSMGADLRRSSRVLRYAVGASIEGAKSMTEEREVLTAFTLEEIDGVLIALQVHLGLLQADRIEFDHPPVHSADEKISEALWDKFHTMRDELEGENNND